MLPDPVVEALPPAPKVVEVGVGGRFELLEALGRALPESDLRAVDVDREAVEDPPSGVQAHVDDVHEPTHSLYRGVDLVVAQRPPVELQPAIARLAAARKASLAIRALKDEWADLEPIVGPHEPLDVAGPWRLWPASKCHR